VQGCLDDFRRRLGYRLELVSATLPDSASVGGNCAWDARIRLRNSGFAAPFNPRGWMLVFESVSTGALTSMDLRSATMPRSDPRRWLPELGTFELTLGARPPASLAPGDYRLLLALPDARASLAQRPEYAIQFANVGLWDAARGLTRLNHTVTLGSCSGPSPLLSATSVSATPGSTVSLPVQFNDGGTQLAAVQFDLSYDAQVGTPIVAQASASNGVAPSCSLPSSTPGQIRCVAIVFVGSLPSNFSFFVPFAVNAAAIPGSSFPLALSGHEFTDPGGETVPGGLEDGSLTVSAVPAPPVLAATPAVGSTINFGAVVTNTTRASAVELRNAAPNGGDDLILSSCIVSGNSAFRLQGPLAFPLSLPPAQSMVLTLEFTPTAAGTQAATLTCTHNAIDSPAGFTLAGLGVNDELLRDGFETP
jgi:hypothetical protein